MASLNTSLSKRQQFFSSIPQVVLDKIMRKVPLEVLLRWRLVCRGWNQIIMSKSWTSKTNLSFQKSIPLLMNCREDSLSSATLMALSSNNNRSKWTTMELDLKDASDLYQRCRLCKPQCEEFLRCTSAGSLGLLFFTRYCASHVDSDFSLLVYNPVTRRLKQLEIPEVPDDPEYKKGYLRLAGVIVDKTEQHYKLLFSTVTEGNELTFKTYFVFDSQTSCWKHKASNIPPFFHIMSKVSCDGCLYFLHTSSKVASDESIFTSSLFGPQLGIYDTVADRWHGVQRSRMPQHERAPYFPQLVQHKGVVFYVVLCQSEENRREDEVDRSSLKTWCFFKLVLNKPDHESTSSVSYSWAKVREMPRNVFEAFEVYTQEYYNDETGRHDICCEGQGDFIYFYCVKPSKKLSPSSCRLGRPRSVEGVVLLHDFERNEWSSLSRYPPFEYADVAGVKLESFRPSFVDA